MKLLVYIIICEITNVLIILNFDKIQCKTKVIRILPGGYRIVICILPGGTGINLLKDGHIRRKFWNTNS